MSEINEHLKTIQRLASLKNNITVEDARLLIRNVSLLFRERLIQAGYDPRQITRLTTKFRDAGRRSAPWKPTSSRVPGRPQDGADGNRINRWLLKSDHKFYADEITATLSEVKFYLQALSTNDAPDFPPNTIQHCFDWLIEHPVIPNTYLDPIQLCHISLNDILKDARIVQSGHLIPLDKGGKHEPKNSFLMLARSNQLQGNLTKDELIALMDKIVQAHKSLGR